MSGVQKQRQRTKDSAKDRSTVEILNVEQEDLLEAVSVQKVERGQARMPELREKKVFGSVLKENWIDPDGSEDAVLKQRNCDEITEVETLTGRYIPVLALLCCVILKVRL